MASSSDRVTYDVFPGKHGLPYPYRSPALYGPDLRAMSSRHVRHGNTVQVIAEHGDSHWTDATYVEWKVTDAEHGITAYVVMIDGAERIVSKDRIRPKP